MAASSIGETVKLINMSKRLKTATVVDSLMAFKTFGYHFEEIPVIQEYLQRKFLGRDGDAQGVAQARAEGLGGQHEGGRGLASLVLEGQRWEVMVGKRRWEWAVAVAFVGRDYK